MKLSALFLQVLARFCFSSKVSLILFILHTSPPKVFGQDIQFSQFYANVLYLNPAFAGSAYVSRAIFHQRLQWPSLDAKYTTSSFSLDHNFVKYNSGLGILLLKDMQGMNTISSTEAALQYAYELNLSNTFVLRTGIETKYVSRHINYGHLTLPDQYDNNGFNFERSSESFPTDKVHFLDLSSGAILYSDHFWAGLTANHLNTPNQSFRGNLGESQLPLKLDFVAGYRFHIEKSIQKEYLQKGKNINITPTIHYKMQGKSDQLDLGIYGMYENLVTGLWYRGLPLVKHYRPGLLNNESMVFLIGWKIKNFITGYSYDVTVSKLHRARTGGSHELNVTYVWDYKKKKRGAMKRLPCPEI